MSEFIRAIEFDQTPNKVMMQFGSELAEQANRAAAARQAAAKLKADQDADIANTFSAVNKMAADQYKDLPDMYIKRGMEATMQSLIKDLLEAKNDPNIFKTKAYGNTLAKLHSTAAGMKQVIAASDALAKEYALLGVRPDVIKQHAADYVLDPSRPFNLEEYKAKLDQDIAERPNTYMDQNVLKKALVNRAEEKGEDFTRGEAYDPTGKRKVSASIGAKSKRWDVVGKMTTDNGLELEVPMLPTEPVKGLGGEFKVVTGDVVSKFIANDPTVAAGVNNAAKSIIHDVNKQLGVNTASMTNEQFQQAKREYDIKRMKGVNEGNSVLPALFDPFNEENILIASRKAVTDILKPYYNEGGYAKLTKKEIGDVKDNPMVINNNIGSTTPANPDFTAPVDRIKAITNGDTRFLGAVKPSVKGNTTYDVTQQFSGLPIFKSPTGKTYGPALVQYNLGDKDGSGQRFLVKEKKNKPWKEYTIKQFVDLLEPKVGGTGYDPAPKPQRGQPR